MLPAFPPPARIGCVTRHVDMSLGGAYHPPVMGDCHPTAIAGREVMRRFSRQMWTRVPVANLAGVLLSAVAGTVAGSGSGAHLSAWDWAWSGLYVAGALCAGGWLVPRESRRAVGWLDHPSPPNEDQQKRVLRLPWVVAGCCMAAWAGGAVLGVVEDLSFGLGVATVTGLSILLGGLTTCGLTYLLVEWALRPVVAIAFARDVPERTGTPGVRLKLLLAWAVGSDVFLLSIGLLYIGRPTQTAPRADVVWYFIAAGLVAGAIVFFVATRSLAAPLMELRRAVRRVQVGGSGGQGRSERRRGDRPVASGLQHDGGGPRRAAAARGHLRPPGRRGGGQARPRAGGRARRREVHGEHGLRRRRGLERPRPTPPPRGGRPAAERVLRRGRPGHVLRGRMGQQVRGGRGALCVRCPRLRRRSRREGAPRCTHPAPGAPRPRRRPASPRRGDRRLVRPRCRRQRRGGGALRSRP